MRATDAEVGKRRESEKVAGRPALVGRKEVPTIGIRPLGTVAPATGRTARSPRSSEMLSPRRQDQSVDDI